jgi:hypothetical protein
MATLPVSPVRNSHPYYLVPLNVSYRSLRSGASLERLTVEEFILSTVERAYARPPGEVFGQLLKDALAEVNRRRDAMRGYSIHGTLAVSAQDVSTIERGLGVSARAIIDRAVNDALEKLAREEAAS